MDPLIDLCRRDSKTYPRLMYDASYVYDKDSRPFEIESITTRDLKSYSDPKLLDFYQSLNNEASIASGEKIVLEWANPLTAVKRFLSQENNLEIKILSSIFGIKNVVMVTPGPVMIATDVLGTHFVRGSPPQNIIIRTPDVLDAYWVHFTYLMSKLYSKITLLQPICLDFRYLVCMGYVGDKDLSLEKLADIMAFDKLQDKVYGFFKQLPELFVSWAIFMNNAHLSFRSEFLIHIVEARMGFPNHYWAGTSYDIQKAVRFISGESMEPKVGIPKSLRFKKEIENVFQTSLHLYGSPEDFSQMKLHTEIDFRRDQRLPYEPLKGKRVGGVHWGQRKLLCAELKELTENVDKDNQDHTLVLYIGAAPWDHGITLMDWFPGLRFVLYDPRGDAFDKRVLEREKTDEHRLKIFRQECDRDTARDEIIQWFQSGVAGDMANFVSGVNRVLVVSDIRRYGHDDVGFVASEFGVHEDMMLQKDIVQIIYDSLKPQGISVQASFKFRLPYVKEIGGLRYKYCKGKLHTQVWAPIGSTELRLWWNPEDGEDEYDKVALEEIMMYHNLVYRSASYGTPKIQGYCPCHDCHYEISLIRNYLLKFKGLYLEDNLQEFDTYSASINQSLRQTLQDYTGKKRIRGVGLTVTYERSGESTEVKRLVYNPDIEDMVSRFLLDLQVEWTDVLGENRERVKDFLITRLFIFGGIRPDLDNDLDLFKSMFPGVSEATIRELKKRLEKSTNRLNEDQEKYESSLQGGREKSAAVSLDRARKGTKKLTHKGNSTMDFIKSLIPKFLVTEEISVDLKNEDISKNIGTTVLPRAYSVLKRYGSIWNDHFSTYPIGIFDDYPVLKNGLILGLTILSGSRNEKFMLPIPKLESRLTDDRYSNILTAEEDHQIIDQNTLLVFLPGIKELWIRAVQKLLPILDKYEGQDKSIVLLIPEELSKEIKPLLESVEIEEKLYNTSFYNSLNGETIKGSLYTLILLKTQQSTFKL